LPQDEGLGVGADCEDHWPTNDVEATVEAAAGAVGASALEEWEKPQAVAAITARNGISLFIIITRATSRQFRITGFVHERTIYALDN
jgi:hypothetical protein